MTNPNLKRVFIGFGILAPAIVQIFFSLQPRLDVSVSLPLFHFYIVTFTTFSAVVVSILLTVALRDIAWPRHVLSSGAFIMMGAIFFTHGLPTPGALIGYFHPALSWSAWLTLFAGGAIFTVAGLDTPNGLPGRLTVRRVSIFASIAVALYFAVALFGPQWLTWIDNSAAPWHRNLIFYITLVLWLFAAFRLVKTWWLTKSRVDGLLSFVSLWMAFATVSMHLFPVWQLSWWLYHFILLFGFLITVYFLLAEYEQAREFRLLRYYLAVSLIVTALMALTASYLFGQFSYQSHVAEKEASFTRLIDNLTSEITDILPDNAMPDEALTEYTRHLSGLSTGDVLVYDAAGLLFQQSSQRASAGNGGSELLANTLLPEFRSGFEQALAGQTTAAVRSPSVEYTPFGNLPTLSGYAPLYLSNDSGTSPIGVAIILEAAQDLVQIQLRARTVGLVITAIIMGILFGALLLVVARADRILRRRSEELVQAYSDLREAEGLRDDLTNMIVHDMRTPLSIIYGSLDLATYLINDGEHDEGMEYIGKAINASGRMTGLIDDILTVSKIEAGQLEPKIIPVSLHQVLSNSLDTFVPQAAEENKQVTIECPSDLIAALDSNLFSRIVENLVSNALKYTKTGGQIQVSAWANDGRIYLRIRDDGGGIADSYKKLIFQKFAQAPNANEPGIRKGTGLGLAFCDLAVQIQGGQIWVEDAPDGGSDFIFYIPQPTTYLDS